MGIATSVAWQNTCWRNIYKESWCGEMLFANKRFFLTDGFFNQWNSTSELFYRHDSIKSVSDDRKGWMRTWSGIYPKFLQNCNCPEVEYLLIYLPIYLFPHHGPQAVVCFYIALKRSRRVYKLRSWVARHLIDLCLILSEANWKLSEENIPRRRLCSPLMV